MKLNLKFKFPALGIQNLNNQGPSFSVPFITGLWHPVVGAFLSPPPFPEWMDRQPQLLNSAAPPPPPSILCDRSVTPQSVVSPSVRSVVLIRRPLTNCCRRRRMNRASCLGASTDGSRSPSLSLSPPQIGHYACPAPSSVLLAPWKKRLH